MRHRCLFTERIWHIAGTPHHSILLLTRNWMSLRCFSLSSVCCSSGRSLAMCVSLKSLTRHSRWTCAASHICCAVRAPTPSYFWMANRTCLYAGKLRPSRNMIPGSTRSAPLACSALGLLDYVHPLYFIHAVITWTSSAAISARKAHRTRLEHIFFLEDMYGGKHGRRGCRLRLSSTYKFPALQDVAPCTSRSAMAFFRATLFPYNNCLPTKSVGRA